MPGLLNFDQAPMAASRASKRAYAGAKRDRLTADWSTTSYSINAELRGDLAPLRSRSRVLANDDPYARRYLRLVRTNVVGPRGIELRPNVRLSDGSLDADANRQILEAWRRWSRRGVATVCGQLSWIACQQLVAITDARDGEALVEHAFGKSARNSFGYGLHVIDVDLLDHTYDTRNVGRSGTDERITMGVEHTPQYRPLFYWLLRDHPSDFGHTAGPHREKKPASVIMHIFDRTRASQVRGVPDMHSVMRRLKMLDGYTEAELVAARVASSKMGFIQIPDGEYDADDEDEDGPITEVEPGLIEQLPMGSEFKEFDPQHPASSFDPFIKSGLHSAAAGLDVGYSSLTSDLTQTSYGSLRAGAIDERDAWRMRQWRLIEQLCVPTYQEWLPRAILAREVNLPMRRLDEFMSPLWRPRGWRWVDPDRESKADERGVRNAAKSRHDIADEQGRDFDEILTELAEEQQRAAELGIDLTPNQAEPIEVSVNDDR